jgi:Leucine-rich repeat (LRR) protein
MKPFVISAILFASSGVIVNTISNDVTENSSQKSIYNVDQLKTSDTNSVENVFLPSFSLTAVPIELFTFSNIKKIDLSENNLTVLPKEFSQLKKLESLNISGNKNIELIESFKNLQGSNVKKLYASDCYLTFIPFEIKSLKQLETLDLSNNAIMEIPYYFGKLKKLKDINLSNNNLSTLDYTIYKIKGLEYLNLENNPDLDMANVCLNLLPLKNLIEVNFSHLSDTLPYSFGAIKSHSITVSKSSINELPVTFESNNQIQSFTFNECSTSDFSKILPILSTINSLTELNLTNCFDAVPSELKLLPQLTYLNLSNNHLTTLPLSSKDLPSLKQLVLYDNNFSEEEWQKIQLNFPNVDIKSNNYAPAPMASKDEISTSKNKEIKPIAAHLDKKDTVYKLTTHQPIKLLYNNTLISIPKDAFVDGNGKIITEPVTIKYREFRNPAEIFLSGIPMGYDSAGISTTFESGGMFEFKATTVQGTEVFPNDKSLIEIDFNSVSSDTDFNEYSFDETTNKWKFEDVSKVNSNTGSNRQLNVAPTFFNSSLKPNFVVQQVRFEMHKNEFIHFIKIHKKSNEFTYAYPNIIFKENTFKYYDKNKAKQADKELSQFNKKYINNNRSKTVYTQEYKVPFVDFTFEIDSDRDCFVATVLLLDTLLELPVKLYQTNNFEKEQKSYVTFWKKYQKEIKGLEKQNAKVEKKYEEKLARFEQELSKFQGEYRNWMTKGDEESKIIRSVVLSSFGLWNIDRLGKMDEPAYITLNLFDMQNKPFEANQYIVLDYTDNGVLTYTTNYICYDKSNKTVLVAMDKENKVMIINSSDFKLIKNAESDSKLSFHHDPIDIKNLSADQFKNLIN